MISRATELLIDFLSEQATRYTFGAARTSPSYDGARAQRLARVRQRATQPFLTRSTGVRAQTLRVRSPTRIFHSVF